MCKSGRLHWWCKYNSQDVVCQDGAVRKFELAKRLGLLSADHLQRRPKRRVVCKRKISADRKGLFAALQVAHGIVEAQLRMLCRIETAKRGSRQKSFEQVAALGRFNVQQHVVAVSEGRILQG